MSIFKRRWSTPATYLILLTLLYGLAASQAIQSYSYKWTIIAVPKEFSMDKVFNGTAPKPYAYRLLVPATINAIIDHAPNRLSNILVARSRATLDATVGPAAQKIDDRIALAYGLTLGLGFPLLVCTLFFLRALCLKILYPSGAVSHLIADAAPVLFALLLTITYRVYNGFVYDHAELFLLTAYLLLGWQEKWLLALPVLALAIINKETAIFFPLFGLVIAWKNGHPPKRRIYVFLAEILIVSVGLAAIHYTMRGRFGTSLEWHVPVNIPFWFSPSPWVAMTSPHVQLALLPKPSNLLILIPMIYCVLGFWRQKPLVLRRLVVISSAINLPLFFLFGWQDEFRNLSLMYPFLFLAAAHTMLEYYRADAKSANAMYDEER